METSLQKYKVLAIDDEPLMLKTYVRMLRSEFIVITASSVKEALQILEISADIDIILLDYMMPEITGLQAIPIIRDKNNYRQIPICIVTGDHSESLQHEALNLGASDFLIKPLSPMLLRLRIRLLADNAKLRAKLEQLALVDSLTELSNRRGMNIHLQREIRRCRRSNTPFSLAMIDIDHFKNINDNFGHSVGDQAIRMIADAIREYFQRGTDVLARFGGEEFIVAAIEMNAEEIQQRMDTFRESVKQRRLIVNDQSLDHVITVSVGGITLIPNDDIDMLDNLIERADKCLYRAKQTRDTQVWDIDDSAKL